MLVEIDIAPDDLNPEIQMETFTLGLAWYRGDQLLCYVFFSEVPGTSCHNVHFDVRQFSHSILRFLKMEWKDVLTLAKQYGISHMVACRSTNEDEAEKWSKLIRHFGFTYPKVLYFSERRI